ncbi:peptide deformylase [Streptomyces sp. NPDC021080]|uniref:peptide deformylase n=1 Tax=Streptomyces sp. NPDC021080 TaxID=3365110 RepID=UPI0037B365EF
MSLLSGRGVACAQPGGGRPLARCRTPDIVWSGASGPGSPNAAWIRGNSRDPGTAQRADAQPRGRPARSPHPHRARPPLRPAHRARGRGAGRGDAVRLDGAHRPGPPLRQGHGHRRPQIGIPRAVAVVQPAEAGAGAIVLLNPRITASSDECDEQYEGCLSFFDVRTLVPRPLTITVETTTIDGTTVTTDYTRGMARLIAHEIDHLDGLLTLNRLRPGVDPIPIEEYRQTGQSWTYNS